MNNLHFISGLPRSGSTLLAGILRQNPRFTAAMQSPLRHIVTAAIQSMGKENDSHLFISDEQRKNILRGIVEGFYYRCNNEKVIFDTDRGWSSVMPALENLFPTSRVICCLRNPAWIVDSLERQLLNNPLRVSNLFPTQNPPMDVYSRADHLATKQLLGPSLRYLRQAWFGEQKKQLIAIRYESLANNPEGTIRQLYELLGEPLFEHDFSSVHYDEPLFDQWLGTPGMHAVRPVVQQLHRATVLPIDLFQRLDECFWELPNHNPGNIPIL